MKIRTPVNAVFGIATEVVYVGCILLVALLVCLLFSLKI